MYSLNLRSIHPGRHGRIGSTDKPFFRFSRLCGVSLRECLTYGLFHISLLTADMVLLAVFQTSSSQETQKKNRLYGRFLSFVVVL